MIAYKFYRFLSKNLSLACYWQSRFRGVVCTNVCRDELVLIY